MVALQPVIDEVATAWPFTEAAVDVSPAAPGVYFLYKNGQLIYIGAATNGSGVRNELESHRRGAHGACTQAATAFLFEVVGDPLAAYKQCLERYRTEHAGRRPVCNEAGLGANER
jgi:hypothetical protein